MLGVGQNVFESEEINWPVSILSHLNPVIEPHFVGQCTSLLKFLPERLDRILSELVLELATVNLAAHQIEKGRVSIKLIARAYNSDIIVPVPLEW